jgi:hypothetical protein
MNLTIPPSYWNQEWLSRQQRTRKIIYPTEEEKTEKERVRKEEYQKKQEQELTQKNENKKRFEEWLKVNLDSFDPNYQPKKEFSSYSSFLVKDDTLQKLRNKLSRKFKIGIPNMELSKIQQRYLLDIIGEEEKKQSFRDFSEKRRKEDERREKQMKRDEEYRKEKKEKQQKWISWYKQACLVALKQRSFKNEASAKKAEKRDLNKMKEMGFFRYIFHHWDSLAQFSKLSNSELIHLFRVKLEEDKIAQKQKGKAKVVAFIEKEKKLQEKCQQQCVEYVSYSKMPSKQWTDSKKWTEWSGEDKERVLAINAKLKKASHLQEWNKLSDQEKQKTIEFRQHWLQLEKEKLKSIKVPERRYRPIVERPDILYSGTGHSLVIDPNWDSERRMEEIQNFNETVRDF